YRNHTIYYSTAHCRLSFTVCIRCRKLYLPFINGHFDDCGGNCQHAEKREVHTGNHLEDCRHICFYRSIDSRDFDWIENHTTDSTVHHTNQWHGDRQLHGARHFIFESFHRGTGITPRTNRAYPITGWHT